MLALLTLFPRAGVAVVVPLPLTLVPVTLTIADTVVVAVTLAVIAVSIAATVRGLTEVGDHVDVAARKRHRHDVRRVTRITANEQQRGPVESIDAEIQAIGVAARVAMVFGMAEKRDHLEVLLAPFNALEHTRPLEFDKFENISRSIGFCAGVDNALDRAVELELQGLGDDLPFPGIAIGRAAGWERSAAEGV